MFRFALLAHLLCDFCLVAIEGIKNRKVCNTFYTALGKQVKDETLITFDTPEEAGHW